MDDFNHRAKHPPILSSLTSITLAIHPSRPLPAFLSAVSSLLSSSPLQNFDIYSNSTRLSESSISPSSSTTTDTFWSRLVETHGQRLRRVSVHRMSVGMHAIEEICKKCVKLEEFFVVVEPDSLVRIHSFEYALVCLFLTHISYNPRRI